MSLIRFMLSKARNVDDTDDADGEERPMLWMRQETVAVNVVDVL